MRDQVAISQFSRFEQGGGMVGYFFGDTTVIAEEWVDIDGVTHLRPVRGDQVACGQWVDLDEDEVAAYCEMLEDEMRGRSEK